MNLQPYQDTPFDDDDAFMDFQMALQLNHDTIAQRMFANGDFYKTYPLIDEPWNVKDWQLTLQQELNSIYALLEMTGLPDLASADLEREQDFSDFMQLLVNAEARVNAALGIK